MARDVSKLRVFELAHQLTLDVYRLTRRLPASERFGLTEQLRRAAASIPTNIVEGCNRRSAREYDRFLDIALGSAAEVRYLLRLIADLEMVSADVVSDCRERSEYLVRSLQNLQSAVEHFT